MTGLIRENQYAQEMQNTVLPYLTARREDAEWEGYDGNRLHYAHFTAENETGVIVISHGFTESCEKYRELTYYFLQHGYSVYIPEHRGHALSYRKVSNLTLTHIDRFEEYVKDFTRLMDTVILPKEQGKPLFIFAHSMGCAIATLYLEENPDVFQKAVFSSPMVEPDGGGIPAFVAKAIVGAFRLFGQGQKRAFISEEYPGHEEFERSVASSRARFEYYAGIKAATPHLQNYSPTYAWVYESLRVKKLIFRKDLLSKVKIPVKIFLGERDTVVKKEPQEKLAAALPNCSLETVVDAKHETYLTPDDTFEAYLDAMLAFLAE